MKNADTAPYFHPSEHAMHEASRVELLDRLDQLSVFLTRILPGTNARTG